MERVVWSREGPAGFHMQAWLPHGGLRGSHYWLCLQHSLLLIQEAHAFLWGHQRFRVEDGGAAGQGKAALPASRLAGPS